MSKITRKGTGVIFESNYGLQDFVGSWNTSVTSEGSMSDEMLVLLSDGTGFVAEANMGAYFKTALTWFVEHDILTIFNANKIFSQNPVKIINDIVIQCYSEEKTHFTALCDTVYGLDFYRTIGNRTAEEAEIEAQRGVKYLLEFGSNDE
ncbi:MAG: hypothetical protein FWB92_02885 [Oscillospiraceae bacterium]|nr:hypothetical protein [Oscillospiraceae bacterium]